MAHAYVRAPGSLIEPIGDSWVAFSALSGETHLLNDTSVAILDLLSPEQPTSHEAVCAELTSASGLDQCEVEHLLAGMWETFLKAGLARRVRARGAAR